MPYPLFCPCPRGLEPLLQTELRQFGLHEIKLAPGGVACSGSLNDVMRINLHSRIASRVLIALKHAPYKLEADIYNLVKSIDWESWFKAEHTLRVDVTGVHSPLKSLNFATLIIKDAVCDRMREYYDERPSVNTAAPDVRIYAFLTDSLATIYIDSSGESLFKRGWRRDKGEAPLKENLAAGLLMLAGWHPSIPLYDPMCGSGTILIEAAQIARGIPAGATRNFGFEKFTQFDAQAWRDLRSKPPQALVDADQIQLFGSDISGDMCVLANSNAQAAKVGDVLTFKQMDARSMRVPFADRHGENTGGMIITNPPYGERIAVRGARGVVKDGDAKMAHQNRYQNTRESFQEKGHDDDGSASDEGDAHYATFFSDISTRLKQGFAGWQVFMFSADFKLPKALRLKEAQRTPLFNGPIECRLFRFDMVAGSNREAIGEKKR